MSQRTQRVDELLRQEIGRILAKDVQDPHVGFATVTSVETTPDLRHARVRVSVIGGSAERAQTLAALERATGFVRHELGVRLRLKRIPALHLVLDESAERGTRVLQILEELERGRDAVGEALADAPLEETLPTPVARVRREGDAEDAEAAPADPSPGELSPARAGTPASAKPPARRRRDRDGGPDHAERRRARRPRRST
jgi:ribosome-binding factor A